MVWAGLPAQRRPSLDDRIAPYVGDRFRAGRQPTHATAAIPLMTPFPTLERIVRPYLADASSTLERILGTGASVRRRLDRAGSLATVHEFRVSQLLWGAAGGAVGLVLGASIVAQGGRSPVLMVIIFVAAIVAGLVACDYELTARVRRRERKLMAEFPSVADLLALAVTAGVGPMAALDRVATAGDGELARELRRALGDARAGGGLVSALDGVAERTALVPLARFADGIAVAVDRGTPLADVLRAQAADVRAAQKRALLEIGGRKEIAMLVPVVFMVLPVTVIFALYPGLVQISSVVP